MDTAPKTAEPPVDTSAPETPGTETTSTTTDETAQAPAPTLEETAAADNATQAESAEAQQPEPPVETPATPAGTSTAASKAETKAKPGTPASATPTPATRKLTDPQLETLEGAVASRHGIYRAKGERGWVYGPAAGGPPFHDDQVVNTLADRGLLVIEPTGGNHGSAKITQAGLAALKAAGRK